MAGVSLFEWYVVTITWSIVFLILASVYLYANRRVPEGSRRPPNTLSSVVKDFVFVWVLISLLVFYVVTVLVKSQTLFAAGNLVVEALLLLYLIKSKQRAPSGT
jgi:hypothetical protein